MCTPFSQQSLQRNLCAISTGHAGIACRTAISAPGVNYPAFRYYHDQYSALYAWRSVGYSNFNALEAVYRQRFGAGLQADFNYTYSKSLDITSQAERLGNSAGTNYAQIMNTWEPNQLYGPSDYDVRHQINRNFVWDLPIGRRKEFVSGAGHLTNELIGGWQTTGIVRWTSGFPFVMNNGAYYPTNWDIQGYAEQIVEDSLARRCARSPDAAVCRSGDRVSPASLTRCRANRARATRCAAMAISTGMRA